MRFTRRRFSILAAFIPWAGFAGAAAPQRGVFWRAKFQSHQLILFGYVRIRADYLPDIVADGKRLIQKTKSVLMDMNPGIIFASEEFDNKDLKPVFTALPKSYQDDLRAVLATSPAKNAIEKLTGFEAAILLIGEGQQGFGPDAPSVGLVLTQYGLSLKRDIKTLASDDEVKALRKPLDAATVNSVDPSAVTFLLDLRRRVGPIGGHFDELYKARNGDEIARLGEEIAARGVLTPSDFLDAERLRTLFIERLARQPAGANAFVILPIGLLSGQHGILNELRSRGAEVTPIA